MIAPNSYRANGIPRAEDGTLRLMRRVLSRHRLLILGLPLITLAAALVFISVATPVYEGTASLRLDQERSNLAVLDALQELSSGNQISTEMREMQSRSRAEDVVEALHLNAEVVQPRRVARSTLFSHFSTTRSAPAARYELRRNHDGSFALETEEGARTVRIGETVTLPGLEFALGPRAALQDVIAVRVRAFPVAVRSLRRHVAVGRPDREANILEIRYEGTDPSLAHQVPNELAARFIRHREEVRKTQARSTVRFLRGQIDTLGVYLAHSERGLLAFREQQRVISPQAEGATQVNRLAQFQADRDRLDAERSALAAIVAEAERATTAGAYRRVIGFPALLQNPAASELLRSLNEVENERAQLLKGRTEADPAVAALTQRIRQMDADLRALVETHLQGIGSTIASLDATLALFSNELQRIPAKEIQLARLRREAEVTEEIYTELQTRLQEAQIAAAVEDASVRVVDPAIVPLKPIRPNRPLSIALALLLGLMLGAGLAFAREHMDSTIRNRDELQEMSGSIPVLGQVPRIRLATAQANGLRRFSVARNGDAASDWKRTTAGRDARGPVAEAYRTLRTNIAFTQPDAPAKVIVITSALPGEGKSTSSCNLAITLAQQGLRVVLVDGDMRRGTLHLALGAQLEPGLSNVLLGRVQAADALQQVELEGISLSFVSTGTLPPNPAELLASPRALHLIEHLKAQFDAVLIDSPPLNVVTDAAIAGSRADGVLLVARSGVTERDAYRHAVTQLESVHARVLGCVLNDVDVRTDGYYGRRARQYYAAQNGS